MRLKNRESILRALAPIARLQGPAHCSQVTKTHQLSLKGEMPDRRGGVEQGMVCRERGLRAVITPKRLTVFFG